MSGLDPTAIKVSCIRLRLAFSTRIHVENSLNKVRNLTCAGLIIITCMNLDYSYRPLGLYLLLEFYTLIEYCFLSSA